MENYVEIVKYILSKSVEDIMASPDCLKLIRCYSVLYENNQRVGTCVVSQRKYYNQLKKNGLQMAQNYDVIKTRTNQPNWVGIIAVSATNKHYNSETISDEEATNLLNNKYLEERYFKVLPQPYLDQFKSFENDFNIISEKSLNGRLKFRMESFNNYFIDYSEKHTDCIKEFMKLYLVDHKNDEEIIEIYKEIEDVDGKEIKELMNITKNFIIENKFDK